MISKCWAIQSSTHDLLSVFVFHLFQKNLGGDRIWCSQIHHLQTLNRWYTELSCYSSSHAQPFFFLEIRVFSPLLIWLVVISVCNLPFILCSKESLHVDAQFIVDAFIEWWNLEKNSSILVTGSTEFHTLEVLEFFSMPTTLV